MLIPESLGSISQVNLLKGLNTLVISTTMANHAYVDLKDIILTGSGGTKEFRDSKYVP